MYLDGWRVREGAAKWRSLNQTSRSQKATCPKYGGTGFKGDQRWQGFGPLPVQKAASQLPWRGGEEAGSC